MENYNVFRTQKAENDLLDIALYIAVQNAPEVAYRLVDAIEKEILRLEQFPHSGSPQKFRYTKKTGYRFLVVENYLIHYHTDDRAKIVYIDRIRHGAISPTKQLS